MSLEKVVKRRIEAIPKKENYIENTETTPWSKAIGSISILYGGIIASGYSETGELSPERLHESTDHLIRSLERVSKEELDLGELEGSLPNYAPFRTGALNYNDREESLKLSGVGDIIYKEFKTFLSLYKAGRDQNP